jgi:uncharacterized damage-inducible protein DinB
MAESVRDRFLKHLRDEYTRTDKVLRAFPNGKLDFKPHEKAMTAKQLAWLLVMGHGFLETAVTKGFDFSKPFPKRPDPPDTVEEMAAALKQGLDSLEAAVKSATDDRLAANIQFMIGPKQVGDVNLTDFLWFILFDHVHHRGQFSTYLRLVGAKVPSIYGPSADEPWT